MWESSPRRFHTGFLLSALTFRVPEGLIPAQILLFVLSSPFPPRGFTSEAGGPPADAPGWSLRCAMTLLVWKTHLDTHFLWAPLLGPVAPLLVATSPPRLVFSVA